MDGLHNEKINTSAGQEDKRYRYVYGRTVAVEFVVVTLCYVVVVVGRIECRLLAGPPDSQTRDCEKNNKSSAKREQKIVFSLFPSLTHTYTHSLLLIFSLFLSLDPGLKIRRKKLDSLFPLRNKRERKKRGNYDAEVRK